MNPEALLSHAPARALPEKSKERALALLSLRQLWHALFDPCPDLAQAFPQKDAEIFEPFLEYAAKQKFSMGWSLHAHLLPWLAKRWPQKVTADIFQELLAAAAARWASSDQTETKGLILYLTDMPELGVTAWKNRSVDEGHRVVLVKLPKQNLANAGIFFASLPEYQYPDTLSWRPLPN